MPPHRLPASPKTRPLFPKNRLSQALTSAVIAVGTTAASVTAAPAAAAVGHPQHPSSLMTAHVNAPAVLGRAAYLLDASTGEVQFSKAPNRRMPVASLTKVMTAQVVLKEAKPTDTVTITPEDVRYGAQGGASVAYLQAGDRLTVEDLLYALLLPSGSDAAHALARTYGPGVSGFVAKMNTAARNFGMRDTRYVNIDGMPTGGGGYSTARDQARLAQIALRKQELLKITSTRHHTVAETSRHGAYSWTNTNSLLGTPGVIGLKTGFTRAAGYNLSFAADSHGRRLVGVILGETVSSRRFQTARALLNWAAHKAAGTPYADPR
ncbi:D-alanyl-D-alanine carboxypeptidase family protein [Acrocarpospora catenulata]|uniref:D-alanyl-D-alanine carboxypeptidase family protein n=1 Tax=Acrocarpospora catenulata TaxID=2836182 RepID=UPI001BD9FB63|nr:D-alanyl-D-alanine carboxypeptidase family protein [Acrocarpospora catenulata]